MQSQKHKTGYIKLCLSKVYNVAEKIKQIIKLQNERSWGDSRHTRRWSRDET